MQDVYIEKFSDLVETVQRRTGYIISQQMKIYLSCLLANHIDKTDFWDKSFGVHYAALETWHRHAAKELADNCLVLTGIFPGYGERRGISLSYYADIGAASYGMAAEITGSDILHELSKEYYKVSEFLNHVQR